MRTLRETIFSASPRIREAQVRITSVRKHLSVTLPLLECVRVFLCFQRVKPHLSGTSSQSADNGTDLTPPVSVSSKRCGRFAAGGDRRLAPLVAFIGCCRSENPWFDTYLHDSISSPWPKQISCKAGTSSYSTRHQSPDLHHWMGWF